MLKNHTGESLVVMDTKQSGCYQQVYKKYDEVWHFGNTVPIAIGKRVAELK